jgi:hypothetical protein
MEIHEFHNGVSRELYNRYTVLDSATAVSRAIALGILGEDSGSFSRGKAHSLDRHLS